jgi:hypothetical protein
VGSRAQWRHALMGAWRHAGLVHVGQGHSQEVAVGEGPRQGLAVTRHTPLEYACYDTCAHPLCWPVVLHPQVCGCNTTPGAHVCMVHPWPANHRLCCVSNRRPSQLTAAACPLPGWLHATHAIVCCKRLQCLLM